MTILYVISLIATMSVTGCGMPQILSVFSGKPEPQSRQTELAVGQLVTLDGYDASAGIVVRRITLWKDQNNRAAGISATANHGDGVKFIQREGDSVLVETTDGKRGWVTSYFIKELK